MCLDLCFLCVFSLLELCEAGLTSPVARKKLSVGSGEMNLNPVFALYCMPSCLTVWCVKPVYQLGIICGIRSCQPKNFHPGSGFLMPLCLILLPPPRPVQLIGSARCQLFGFDSDFCFCNRKVKNSFIVSC